MCSKVLFNKNLVTTGDHLNFTIEGSKIVAGRWGMFQDSGTPQINARIEYLRTTWKREMDNRGVLEFDGFFEKEFYFYGKTPTIKVPVIFDNNYDFAILTRTARSIVAPVHSRQPIIMKSEEENQWLDSGKIYQVADEELLRIHKSKMEKAA